jgi:curved DNA-binding protein CbpA
MATGKADPYAVLGVDRAASASEIRAAYRALVARYHPDRHQGNPLENLASERMVEINQAYELLSDPARRAAFDGGTGGGPGDGRGTGSRDAAPSSSPRRPGMHPVAKWGLVILALTLLVRGGAGLGRAVVGLGRGLFGALSGLRGTPAGLGVALLALGVLAFALWRRHRRRR